MTKVSFLLYSTLFELLAMNSYHYMVLVHYSDIHTVGSNFTSCPICIYTLYCLINVLIFSLLEQMLEFAQFHDTAM